MAIACPAPNPDLGVAVRLAGYLDCQARALGENGFQALAGGPVAAGLLSGLVTIFVALIGYRLLLGRTPDLGDGIGWAVRLGVVLALVTSWPAFQTLVYRVAVDAPNELAALLLPASGLPSEGLEMRIQQAYDTMRLGFEGEQQAPVQPGQASQGADPSTPAQAGQPQIPLQTRGLGYTQYPQTASVFVITTAGVAGGFRLAVGFLLAIGPIAILGLLFDATLGLFSGWVRALGGAALGALAATIVTALDLVAVESELANLQAYSAGGISQVIDPQGLTTVVLLFGIVMLVTALAAVRVMGAFRLAERGDSQAPSGFRERTVSASQPAPSFQPSTTTAVASGQTGLLAQPRTAAIADALAATVRREQMTASGGGAPEAPSRRVSIIEASARAEPGGAASPLGVAGRRSIGRRTLSAERRDHTR